MRVVIAVILFHVLISEAARTRNIKTRVVGGSSVDITSFPFQISLQYNKNHICGASILSETFGVTAAHCVIGKLLSGFSVYVGSNNNDEGGIRRDLSSIKRHPGYNTGTIDYDIAIVKFNGKLQFGQKIAAVKLPTNNYVAPAGTLVYITGWGTTRESGTQVSTTLQGVQVRIIMRAKCGRLYMGKGVITPRMICAGNLRGGQDACQGDSGGPLSVNGMLIGIVSWGYGCARPGYPGIYTNVAQLRTWIRQNSGV